MDVVRLSGIARPVFSMLLLIGCGGPEAPVREEPAPPVAEVRPTTRSFHGIEITDPYAWLRPDNWAEALHDPSTLPADIRAHLEAENAYTDAVLAPVRPLQQALEQEMAENFAHMGNPSVLKAEDGWYYYRRSGGTGLPVYLRSRQRPDLSSPDVAENEQVLLDSAARYGDAPYFKIGATGHSPDHGSFAYSVDTVGSESYAIHVLDPATGDDRGAVADGTSGEFVWGGDDSLYFIRLDEHQRRTWVYRTDLTAGGEELVYHNQDPRLVMGLDTTSSGRFIRITLWNEETTETLLIDRRDPQHRIRTTLGREWDRQYDISDSGGHFYVRDTDGGTPEFAIYRTPIDDLGDRTVLVPERAGVNVWDMKVFSDYLAWQEIEDARISIHARNLVTGTTVEVPFAEDSFMAVMLPEQDFDGPILRLLYRSPTTPGQIIDFDMASGTVVATHGEPSVDRSQYVLQLVTVETHDGEQLPLTVFHRRDTPIDSSAPALLTGYGGHGSPSHFMFMLQPLMRSLADRGWVTALAHVRGSSDRGRQWSLDGKKLNKIHGFNDLIDATQYLIDAHYTSKGNVSLFGASAGGYLVGATTNMRPDLYRSVIAAVPFVDVLDSELDLELPPTYRSWSEWGDPVHSKEQFENLLRISPYDNVTAQPYPTMLLTGGVADLRVPFWEPAKFAARLRASTTGKGKILLWMRGAGHGATTGGMLSELAEYGAFLLWTHGLAG